MNKIQWLEKLNANWLGLNSLIGQYHPHYRGQVSYEFLPSAPNAEKACEGIRQEIKDSRRVDIDKAFLEQDVEKLHSILNQTWFGIPESRSLVNKLGPIFYTLCDLCEGYDE